MIARLHRWLLRMLSGERRRAPRLNAERVHVVNRQYAAAERLARAVGTTPEELLDYRTADRILGGRG